MATERQSLRPYQAACLEEAKRQNLIIHLGTNLGKTLIAMRLIEHHLTIHVDKTTIILVPSQPLVDQHATSCKNQIQVGASKRPPRVLKIVETAQAGWRKEDWDQALTASDVLIATPDIIRKAMITRSYIKATQFSVMVFDECHHATGGHPMATVILDGIRPHDKRPGIPRLLGLSASFSKGHQQTLEQARRNLESLFDAKILCPDVENAHVQPVRVLYGPSGHSREQLEFVESQLKVALKEIGKKKEIQKVVKACDTVFKELGRESLIYYVEGAIVQQVINRIAVLKSITDDENAVKHGNALEKGLPLPRQVVANLITVLLRSPVCSNDLPLRTPKLERLLKLLVDRFSETATNGYRGIVFVGDLCLVPTLAKQINAGLANLNVRCGVVAGSRAQPMTERQLNLDGFRDGKFRVLVATAVLEEGVDVPECQFSVVFTKFHTAKTKIQISGRVSHTDAEHYYFENDPDAETYKAERLVAVAKDKTLSLTKEARVLVCKAKEGLGTHARHPYPFGSCSNGQQGTVNVFNCKEILMEYCQTVLCELITPSTDLFEYENESLLISVRYPTPDSWKFIQHPDVLAFWGSVDHQAIFSRLKNASAEVRRERFFVYVAVVGLREKGLLNANNKPSQEAIELCKHRCPMRENHAEYEMTFKSKATIPENGCNGGCDGNEGNIGEMSLSNFPGTLLTYVEHIFPEWGCDFDDLFVCEMAPRHMPMYIRFPTPLGWLTKSFQDFQETFEDLTLSDQLPLNHISRKSTRQKVQLGMAYLAVMELSRRKFLDDNYLPCLTQSAILQTRELFQTSDNAVPIEIDVSEAHVSSMSVSYPSGSRGSEIGNEHGTVGDISMATSGGSGSEMQVDDLVGNRHEETVSDRTIGRINAEANGRHASQFDDADSDVSL